MNGGPVEHGTQAMVDTHSFLTASGTSLSLDIYPASGDRRPPAGTVIYVHGGGFVGGDRTMDAARIRAMTAEGLTVVSIDYRLAPSARFPDPVDDVRSAIHWVRSNKAKVRTRSSKVALWGCSAGAVLAGLAALAPSANEEDSTVQAVVSWFGFSDIATSASRSPLEAKILPPGPEHAFLGVEDLADRGKLVREASPIAHVTASAPPFLIAHGDHDHVVDVSESKQLHSALIRAGATSSLLILGGAGHEDPRFDSEDTIAITAGFLRSHLTDLAAAEKDSAP